ncbi:MAG: membrane protein insertion efficiency factor YidD [Candidatus Competibacteraceae bacterium]|nr:membrane protein insertion efficiency factor YidD [Candidatus Competibacteraceae bacterium]
MRFLLLLAIHVYQRHVSRHKGFCCAYHVHTARASCSTLGYRAVRRYGGLAGFAILRKRLHLCGVAWRRNELTHHRPFPRQRGDCDIGCDLPCDSPGDWVPDACNCGSCDWPEKKRKKRKKGENEIYIPPKRSR